MSEHFNIAIENLYLTFSKYPFKSTIKGCPCCVSDSDKLTLHSKSLRELDDEDISRYAFKAMTTWGDVYDYKHYLPRILELTAKRKLIVDVFVTLGKLEYAKFEEWDQTEQDSILIFLKAWWKYDINNEDSFDEEVFVELNKKIKDLPSMLGDWNIEIGTKGFINFIDFLDKYYYLLIENKSIFKNFSILDLQYFQNWVYLNKDKLEQGFYKFEKIDKELSQTISNLLYTIDRIYEQEKPNR